MTSAMPRRDQDAGYWRSRYVQELAGLQAQVEKLQDTEELLRRLSSRFCIALSGRDPATDTVILRLRQALRNRGQPEALRPLISELSTAVDRMDAAQAVQAPRSQGLSELHAVLKNLLDSIRFDEALQPQVQALGQRLESWDEQATDVGELIHAIAELVNLQSHGLQDSLLKFEQVFGRINHRLGEMFEHVAQDAEAFEAAQASGRTLEQQLLGEVTDLGLEVQQSHTLDVLQRQVDTRLRRIETRMQEFRAREQEQGARYRERAEHMRERIKELESQASALETAMRRQKRRALVDPVTGIPNRAAYLRQVQAYLKRSERNATPLCVAVWDIDHFKQVNDTFGHKAGDKALRLVGRKLAEGVRESDFVARYGGEEFVMLLENTRLAQAVPALDALRKVIAETPFHHQGEPVSLTISCGVTEISGEADLDTAFERADAALYQSKRSGRNRISSA